MLPGKKSYSVDLTANEKKVIAVRPFRYGAILEAQGNITVKHVTEGSDLGPFIDGDIFDFGGMFGEGQLEITSDQTETVEILLSENRCLLLRQGPRSSVLRQDFIFDLTNAGGVSELVFPKRAWGALLINVSTLAGDELDIGVEPALGGVAYPPPVWNAATGVNTGNDGKITATGRFYIPIYGANNVSLVGVIGALRHITGSASFTDLPLIK